MRHAVARAPDPGHADRARSGRRLPSVQLDHARRSLGDQRYGLGQADGARAQEGRLDHAGRHVVEAKASTASAATRSATETFPGREPPPDVRARRRSPAYSRCRAACAAIMVTRNSPSADAIGGVLGDLLRRAVIVACQRGVADPPRVAAGDAGWGRAASRADHHWLANALLDEGIIEPAATPHVAIAIQVGALAPTPGLWSIRLTMRSRG